MPPRDTHAPFTRDGRLEELRRRAREALSRGVPARDVAVSTGLSLRTIQRIAKDVRVPELPAALEVLESLRGDVELLRATVETARERAETVEERLARERARHDATHARERRKDEEVRRLRKGRTWQRLALDLAWGVYDLLPESVWIAILAGDVVRARFDHAGLDDADRNTDLALEESYASALRIAFTVRESVEDREDDRPGDESYAVDPRSRFIRAWRAELEGD